MQYIAPHSLDEAYRALEASDARCLAGGQSLMAMMNLGLVAPSSLVSLRNITSLRGIGVTADGGMRIGAMTTHAELAALDVAAAGPALLAAAARVVAYPAVRQWGTIGGSTAHADPSADYPVALVAVDAIVEIGSAAGLRRVPAREFFRGFFETALREREIVTAIHVPPGPKHGGAVYQKLSPVAGDFAIVAVAAIAGLRVSLAVGGYGPIPLLISGIEITDDALLAAGQSLANATVPPGDHRASSAYRRRVLPELIRRAGRAAADRRLG